jgi:16S rRNA (guanine527-N7)-methyltransferase
MLPARIAELLHPFVEESEDRESRRAGLERSVNESSGVTPDILNHISTYIDILLRWNARINLTAIRDRETIVTRHFGESLFAARHLLATNRVGTAVEKAKTQSEEKTGGRAARQRRVSSEKGESGSAPEANDERQTTNRITLADLGSGAGFPGIPIKLWIPRIALTLIESNHKKATFLHEITRALTLTDINVLPTRAESIASASFDIVTVRAVERFESILPTASSLIAPGGRLALLIGSSQQSAARYALPNLVWSDPLPIPLSQSRILLFADKPVP